MIPGRGRPAWEDLTPPAPAPAVAPLTAPLDADVCIIGLGTSGLAAAQRLAERGAAVVALDAVGVAAGASGRNGGFLLGGGAAFHHDMIDRHGRELARRLYRATLEELEATAATTPAAVRRTGSLRIAASQAEAHDCRRHLRALRDDGVAALPYTGPEGTGLLIADDAAFDPVARTRHLATAAAAAGAALHGPAPVTGLDGTTVRTAGPAVTAAAVVVAVDAGLEVLLPEVAGRVRTARLQMLATAPDGGVDLPRPVYRNFGYDYVQQLPTGEVLLGGCRDRHELDEWSTDLAPTAGVQDCLDGELDRLGVTAPVTHRWAAGSAYTTDHLPVCEQVRPGVHAAGAYNGHGNLLGPICARAAADAALERAAVSLPWRD